MTSHARWVGIRSSLKKVGDDFAELVENGDPAAMVTEHWTVADAAAHVTGIATIYTSLVRGEKEFAFPEVKDSFQNASVDTVHDFNAQTLRAYKERSVPRITARLANEIDNILKSTADMDPDIVVPWLGSSFVPIAGVLAHLINELMIHGWDVARATKQPWDMDPVDAGHFNESFLVGVMKSGYGHLIDGGGPPSDRRVAVQFRSRYTSTSTIVLHRGIVTIEEPRPDNDVRITFNPPTLNLMLFGRVSRARAALTGGIRVSGPRPWLLPRFLRTVRLPSGPGQPT